MAGEEIVTTYSVFRRGTFEARVIAGSPAFGKLIKIMAPVGVIKVSNKDELLPPREIMARAPGESGPPVKVSKGKPLGKLPKQSGRILVGKEWFIRGGIIARKDRWAIPDEPRWIEEKTQPDTLAALIVETGPIEREIGEAGNVDKVAFEGAGTRVAIQKPFRKLVDAGAVFATCNKQVGILCQNGTVFFLGIVER
jgi:hypothetical protein